MWPETGEKVDLELALLQRLAETHRPLLVKVRSVEPDSIELSALSAFLHALYTGIENIFKRIALEMENGDSHLFRGYATETAKRAHCIRVTKSGCETHVAK